MQLTNSSKEFGNLLVVIVAYSKIPQVWSFVYVNIGMYEPFSKKPFELVCLLVQTIFTFMYIRSHTHPCFNILVQPV